MVTEGSSNPTIPCLSEENQQVWSDGPRGSKAGREHRTKGQEMDFKLQPCRCVNPSPSLGLSFLQVKHRPRTKCPRVSLAPTVEWALASTSDLQLFSGKQMEYVWLFSMCFFHTLLQNVFLCSFIWLRRFVVRDTKREIAVIAAVCSFCFFKAFSCPAHLSLCHSVLIEGQG